MRVRLGLAAWSNKHFDHALYPIGTRHAQWLPRYSSLFDIAEADVLHHRPAEAGTLAQWVDSTPPGFLFLPKMHKEATHGAGGVTVKGSGRAGRNYAWLNPTLPPDPEASAQQTELDSTLAQRFMASVEPLAAAGKLGPTLLQFGPNTDRVGGWDRMVSILGTATPGTFAVEVRHTSWFVPAFEQLLEDFEAPLVWSTFPAAFAPPWRTASYGYVRFTGKHMAKRGRHVTQADRTKDVQEIARRLKDAGWDTVHAIVTNGFEGNAVDSMGKVAAHLGADRVANAMKARSPGGWLFPDGPAKR